MVFSLLLSLLADLLDEADEVVEAERAPGSLLEVVVGEGFGARNVVNVRVLRELVFGYASKVESAACFADGTVFLEVGETIDAGGELGTE